MASTGGPRIPILADDRATETIDWWMGWPAGLNLRVCKLLDADADGDVDLRDLAAVMNANGLRVCR